MSSWEIFYNDEVLADEYHISSRYKVNGGWLVHNHLVSENHESSTMTFVPDIHHVWRIDSE